MYKIVTSALVGATLMMTAVAQESQIRFQEAVDLRLGIDSRAVVGQEGFTLDGQAQPSGPDFGSEQEEQEDGSYLVTISGSTANLRGMNVSSTAGVAYTDSQIERLMQLIEAGRTDLLGLTMAAPRPALPQVVGPNVYRLYNYSMPTIPFSQEVSVFYNAVTYPGDSDKVRTIANFYNANGEAVYKAYDTGQVDFPAGSPDDWAVGGPLYKRGPFVVTSNYESVRLTAVCYRESGNNCSGIVDRFFLTFNHDLPAVGEQVVVREP